MNHALIAPVLGPALLAAGCLLLGQRFRPKQWLAGLGLFGLLLNSLWLLQAAEQGLMTYRLGNWTPPFGIVLVGDRLAALLLAVTAVLSLICYSHALLAGWDRRGRHFHELWLLQLMGLNGAFLTGDLFNLFVFFEVLLASSYGLLLHSADQPRLRFGLGFVVLNLVGSAVFLVAVAGLYGLLGTLNMADLARHIAVAPQADRALLQACGCCLLVVFGLKAAALPLHLWLPATYAAACPPVAALFAIMTKVGCYALLRLTTLLFGLSDNSLLGHIMLLSGLLTLAVGAIGVMGARSLRGIAAYMVIGSVGTLLLAFGLGTRQTITAGLFYLIHATWAAAALFLLVEPLLKLRGNGQDKLLGTRIPIQRNIIGGIFVIAAAGLVGLPPTSGFIAKLALLQASAATPWHHAAWALLLGSSLLSMIAITHAGTLLFWKPSNREPSPVPPPRVDRLLAGGTLLALLTLWLAVAAQDIWHYVDAAAQQLLQPQDYVEKVLYQTSNQPSR